MSRKELKGVLLVTTRVQYSVSTPEMLERLIEEDLKSGLHIDRWGFGDGGSYSLKTIGGGGVRHQRKKKG